MNLSQVQTYNETIKTTMRMLSYRHGDDRAMMLTFKTQWNIYRRDLYQQTSFGPSNKNISFHGHFLYILKYRYFLTSTVAHIQNLICHRKQ